ncbi:MAG: hypothetical protein ACE5GM_07255 [bacterium]
MSRNVKYTNLLQFAVSFSLLANEVLLTRIYSAKFMKYFSLMAISLAMAGLGLGGIITFIRSERIKKMKEEYLFNIWLYFSLTLPLPLFYMLFFQVPTFFATLGDLLSVIFFSFICLIPFFFGGLLLAYNYQFRAGRDVRIYFWDLLGAAGGALGAFFLLNVTDGFSAVILVACFSQLGLVVWSGRQTPGLRKAAFICLIALGGLWGINHVSRFMHLDPPIRRKSGNDIEIWSEFGFTTVASRSSFKGTGISVRKPFIEPEIFKFISHDYNSSTMAVNAGYDRESLKKLTNQINAFPFLYKQGARGLILGSGGGKDVFTALLSGAEHITAVEFNRIIARKLMRGKLKKFSGDIYGDPRVSLKVEEARNFLNNDSKKYDVILPVMGSTPGMIAAGYYTFSTEYLQTVEAYQRYLDHLTTRGIFAFPCSFKRHKLESEFQPQYRILATIRQVLQRNGMDPRRHMLAVGGEMISSYKIYDYACMVLFSPSPFSRQEVAWAGKVAKRIGFEVIYSPFSRKRGRKEPLLTKFLNSDNDEFFYEQAKINIEPVHDDRPYYYFQSKKLDIWNTENASQYLQHISSTVKIYLFYLGALFFIPVVISRPQRMIDRRFTLFRYLVYFGLIGTAFIILELTLMQKVIFFLGIPTYGVLTTIAAFTLSMGAGGLLAGRTLPQRGRWWMLGVLIVLGLSMIYWQFVWPEITAHAGGADIFRRILIATLSLMVPGLVMGFPFVLGIKRFSAIFPEGNAWVWGINAAATTAGATLVTLLWVGYGFTETALLGCFSYLLAFLLI